MGKRHSSSRRVFIHRLSFLGGGVVLLGSACKKSEPAADAGAVAKPEPLTTSHKTFTNEEFKVVSAAADRLLPRDEDPGALDANVPEYIDRALQLPQLEKMREEFTAGAAALNRRSQRMFKVPFYDATAEQKDELLRIFRDSPEGTGEAHWYETLIVLTMEGFLGDPSYGGNKDKAGWKLVGFSIVDGQAPGPAESYDGMKYLLHKRGP